MCRIRMRRNQRPSLRLNSFFSPQKIIQSFLHLGSMPNNFGIFEAKRISQFPGLFRWSPNEPSFRMSTYSVLITRDGHDWCGALALKIQACISVKLTRARDLLRSFCSLVPLSSLAVHSDRSVGIVLNIVAEERLKRANFRHTKSVSLHPVQPHTCCRLLRSRDVGRFYE